MIQRVKQILERLGAQYAVIGAMAMAARGFPRFTLDFDFLTTDKRVLDPNVWDGLVGEGVAVIVGKWKWEHRVIERAEPLEIAGTTLPVVTTSDLVLLKLNTGGIKSRLDVAGLLEVGPREQLIAEVEAKLGDLPSTAEKDARTM